MTDAMLEEIRVRLLEGVTDPKLISFFNTSFQNMKINPDSVVLGCTELITKSQVPDNQSAYILGSIAGIALCLSLDRG